MIVKISKSHTSEASPINQELERLVLTIYPEKQISLKNLRL